MGDTDKEMKIFGDNEMELTALYNLSYGLYIVSSVKDEKLNGQIASTVFQITSEPPTVAISINKQNLTYEFITQSKIFSVSILSKETPMDFIDRFGFRSGRETDKFKDINYKLGITGTAVVLEHTIAYLEAEVINMVDCGTHTIFVGKIINAETIDEAEPMTYAYYHKVKKGKSPKTAPTYIKEELKKEENKK